MDKYEFDGEKYKKASKHQKEWGNKLISQIRITGNEHILDLGCGDGALTEQLSELVPDGRVVGIDSSVSMIDTANAIKKANLSFICLDINRMDFDNRFDIIFSNAALHWVKNHRQLLNHCFRALKPRGRLAWNFAAEGNCSNFFGTVDIVMSMPVYQEFFIDYEWPWYMPNKDEYMQLIKQAGFKQHDVSYENADRYFSDVDEMIKWIDQPSIVPFLKCLPVDKKENFRNRVVDIMIDKTEQSDGRCFETFRRLNVTAGK